MSSCCLSTIFSNDPVFLILVLHVGILPENSKGIVCVVKNNVGQAFTYRVDGEDAKFMGMGDYHEAQFRDLAIAASYSFDASTNGYTGAELDDSAITYEITVYPSSEMKGQFASNISVLFTVVMVFIFVFTVITFVAYDRVVQQRQDIVMAVAERSGAVLASLFPKAVKDRLMAEAMIKPAHGTSRLKNFLSGFDGEENDKARNPGNDDFAYSSKPIADLFAETTVL